MRKFKFGIPLVGAIAIAFGLSGCADESHWGNSSNEKGSIRLNLTADTGIKSAKPVFRSDEGDSKEGDLSDFLELPTLDDFRIKLEKTSTGETSSWTFPEFKDYIEKNKFETGTYTLTAYYGEKGKQDFESPYIEGSTTFNILADQDNEISLTAELMNSMIKINYTDAFKDYMKDYHTAIKTEGIADPITYGTLETRPVFVEPKNANLTVHFTTKGKGITSAFNLGEFPPVAKTLHSITFDLSENASTGDATLEVKFDDTLEDEIIKVDLTEELLTAPAPTIECIGFENGQTLDLLEGGNDIETIKMQATASNKIVSGILTIESATYNPSWGSKEIDLCKATAAEQSAITNEGIVATGFGFNGTETDLFAALDLTKFSQSTLPEGNHKISLIVTDEKGKVSESAAVIFDNQEITLTKVGEPFIVYGSNRAELTFQYNGLDPMNDIHFFEEGNDNRILQTSCLEQPGTRAAEMKTYLITLPLTNTVKSNVKITAYQKGTTYLNDFTIPVSIPEYSVEAFDSYTKHAYAKISTTDPSVLSAITQNIEFKGNNSTLTISSRDASNGIITFSDLTPATTYSMSSSITGSDETSQWNNNGSMTTETELPVPNGDFENLKETINATINQGGKWTITNTPWSEFYQTTLTMIIKEPENWTSSNSTTCNLGAQNVNSWYVIPSVYNTSLTWKSNQPKNTGQSASQSTADVYLGLKPKSGNNAMVIRNVAWDANGEEIGETKQTGSADKNRSNYYGHSEPNISNRSAGVLYLGSDSKEGYDFPSRPSKLKGFYSYHNDSQDPSEKGKITVEFLNGNTSIGTGTIELEASEEYNEFVIPITYISSSFLPKATTLKIMITSSNKTSDIKTTNYCNRDECCSRGAALTVDNLTFEY